MAGDMRDGSSLYAAPSALRAQREKSSRAVADMISAMYRGDGGQRGNGSSHYIGTGSKVSRLHSVRDNVVASRGRRRVGRNDNVRGKFVHSSGGSRVVREKWVECDQSQPELYRGTVSLPRSTVVNPFSGKRKKNSVGKEGIRGSGDVGSSSPSSSQVVGNSFMCFRIWPSIYHSFWLACV